MLVAMRIILIPLAFVAVVIAMVLLAAPMMDAYDKERTAALIEEARQLTADLKTETEKIKAAMTRVLTGDEDKGAILDGPEAETVGNDPDFSGAAPAKSFWRFWC